MCLQNSSNNAKYYLEMKNKSLSYFLNYFLRKLFDS